MVCVDSVVVVVLGQDLGHLKLLGVVVIVSKVPFSNTNGELAREETEMRQSCQMS